MPVVLLPHPTNGNIYIRELGRAYASLGWTPVYGPENLLEGNLRPDLLHLHWPEEFYRWRGEGSTEARAEHFVAQLHRLREAGVPMVWTVHNLAPHDIGQQSVDGRTYAAVMEAASAIHHHCPHSVHALAQRYPVPQGVKQFVQPHGHYLSYPNHVSRTDARRALGIPENARVFLQFGQIRGYKGLGLLLDAFDRLRLPEKFLLVAGLYNAPTGPGAWRERLSLASRKRLRRDWLLHGRSIASEDIQCYVNAADCLVLSHTAGLNSGVAVLGMSFGKPMIGPDLGCLGWVLGHAPNPVCPVGDAQALADAMAQLFERPEDLSALGAANRRAAETWRWEDIAGQALAELGLL